MLKQIALATLLIATTAPNSYAKSIRVDGKCAIPERNLILQRCTILNRDGVISILGGKTLDLAVKIYPSAIIKSGSLNRIIESDSRDLKRRLKDSLKRLNTGWGDANKSNNVRVLQFQVSSGIEPLVLVANRESYGSSTASDVIPTKHKAAETSQSQHAPIEATRALSDFEKEFDRAQSLYEALMFEEADRVLDLAIMRANSFIGNYLDYQGADTMEAVLQRRVDQLRALREFKRYDRELEELQAADRYDELKRQRLLEEQRRREHAYKMAVEYRRAAEATAARWWVYWWGRPQSNIYIIH